MTGKLQKNATSQSNVKASQWLRKVSFFDLKRAARDHEHRQGYCFRWPIGRRHGH
jgi:hypothetical protein